MKLVLISPEGEHPQERAVVETLFAGGLTRYHVRKPHWSAGKLESWLAEWTPSARSRLVLHQHHALVEKFGLLGRHWRDGESAPDAPRLRTDFTSRSCHTLTALQAALGCYQALFLSPIFPSLSKPGYGGGARGQPSSEQIDLEKAKTIIARRTDAEQRTDVIALGGVTPDKVGDCAAAGFDGVAVLGYVWMARDPHQAFDQLQLALHSYAA
jgi:thiamine-phosphate pyrophosphorylase